MSLKNRAKDRRLVALALVAGALGVAGAARAQVSCEPPAVVVLDVEGGVFCAEPNLDCYEDYPPTYVGNGEWYCPSFEQVQAERRRAAGPQISCPMGAVMWDDEAGDWTCEELDDCQACERCYLYVELAKKQCVEKSRRVARAKCSGAYGSTWRGERVAREGLTCEEKTLQDEVTGKVHTIQTNCTGAAIDECIEGWAVSHPGEAAGSSRSASVSYKLGAKGGGKIFGIGVEVSGERGTQDTEGESVSVSWGGGKGFLAACDEGADQVAAHCADCSDVCAN